MYKDVEFVCSGNMARSVLAEAFSRRDLDEKGLLGLVNVSSTGTCADILKNLDDVDRLAQFVIPYLPIAVQRGLMTPEQAEAIKEGRDVKEIISQTQSTVDKKESEKRRIILEERGLVDYFDFGRKPIQTVVRPEAELVFPVDKENYNRVADIYWGSSLDIIIEPLGDIQDPFLFTLEEHRRIADQIEEATRRVIDKYF